MVEFVLIFITGILLGYVIGYRQGIASMIPILEDYKIVIENYKKTITQKNNVIENITSIWERKV